MPPSTFVVKPDTAREDDEEVVFLDEGALREIIAVVATVYDSAANDSLFREARRVQTDTTTYEVTVIGDVVARYDSVFTVPPRDLDIFCPLTGELLKVAVRKRFSLEVRCPIEGEYHESRYLIYALADTSHGYIMDGDHSWIRGDE